MNTTLISNIKAMQKQSFATYALLLYLRNNMHRDSKGDFYMLKDAIYHRPKDNYAYAYDEKRFISEYVRKETMFKAPILFMVILMNGQTGSGFLQVHR